MILSIIVAIAKNNVIGAGGKLLWRLPADLARFKKLTMGHMIIMGRKTFESIGHALPGRENIVISRQPNYQAIGCQIASSLEGALKLASPNKGDDGEEVFIIGGAEIYRQAVPLAKKLYVTFINQDFQGDAYFPPIGQEWAEISRESGLTDGKNPYEYLFIDYERK